MVSLMDIMMETVNKYISDRIIRCSGPVSDGFGQVQPDGELFAWYFAMGEVLTIRGETSLRVH